MRPEKVLTNILSENKHDIGLSHINVERVSL